MNRALKNVEIYLEDASDGLRAALHMSSETESLILLPLIRRVNDTRNEVAALLSAHIAESSVGKRKPT